MRSEGRRGGRGGRHRSEEVIVAKIEVGEEGRRGRGRGHGRGRGEGAKTFRRARALAFLERLQVKRDVLKKQLETVELQTLHPSIVGELKAVEEMMAEYVQLFELHEVEETAAVNEQDEVE